MTCRLALALLALSAAACVDTTPASDVRGNYTLAFSDVIHVKLDIGGAAQQADGSEDGVVTFEHDGQPLSLDLSQFCPRDEVLCPSEAFWTDVAVDQPKIDARVPNSHVINFIDNTLHELPPGIVAEAVGGLIDERDQFSLLIGGEQRGDGGDCGLLALTAATGRFRHEGETVEEVAVDPPAGNGITDAGVVDGGFAVRTTFPPGAPIDGIADGLLKIGFLGACAFGPAVVGASLELSTDFTATRTGELDPPPFVPVDPEDVPQGIVDAGTPDVDAGT